MCSRDFVVGCDHTTPTHSPVPVPVRPLPRLAILFPFGCSRPGSAPPCLVLWRRLSLGPQLRLSPAQRPPGPRRRSLCLRVFHAHPASPIATTDEHDPSQLGGVKNPKAVVQLQDGKGEVSCLSLPRFPSRPPFPPLSLTAPSPSRTNGSLSPPHQRLSQVSLSPGNGYSFLFLKGEQEWVHPMQPMPSLLWKLRKVRQRVRRSVGEEPLESRYNSLCRRCSGSSVRCAAVCLESR
jgi:hypothetical protein